MAEEHRCQAPRLCANNCGFFGSPATQDLCSKCYRDVQLKEQQSSNAKLAFTQTLTASSSSVESPSTTISLPSSPPVSIPTPLSEEKKPAVAGEARKTPQQTANRCSTCRRRVGLTGFKCRCDMTFCGSHRYPEQHACEFDYKSMGREQILKANPLVKAEKLEKI